MSHDAKMQSLRGNNVHFARAMVHHELILGHHLQQFMASHNPVSLLNGFFISDVDPVTGVDRPEVTLHAEIAVGAAISLGFASAGAEGGMMIRATLLSLLAKESPAAALVAITR